MQPPENIDDVFSFYVKFAKPLIFNLPDPRDRVRAASWIQKLRSVADNSRLRNDYLKLLLFVLQRKRLVGPFSDIPPKDEPLEPFPEGCVLTDMAKRLMELDDKVDGSGDRAPISTEMSSDLKEYAAVQTIPNFGVHCYFAISNEPIHSWEQLDHVRLPPERGAASQGMWTADSKAVMEVGDTPPAKKDADCSCSAEKTPPADVPWSEGMREKIHASKDKDMTRFAGLIPHLSAVFSTRAAQGPSTTQAAGRLVEDATKMADPEIEDRNKAVNLLDALYGAPLSDQELLRMLGSDVDRIVRSAEKQAGVARMPELGILDWKYQINFDRWLGDAGKSVLWDTEDRRPTDAFQRPYKGGTASEIATRPPAAEVPSTDEDEEEERALLETIAESLPEKVAQVSNERSRDERKGKKKKPITRDEDEQERNFISPFDEIKKPLQKRISRAAPSHVSRGIHVPVPYPQENWAAEYPRPPPGAAIPEEEFQEPTTTDEDELSDAPHPDSDVPDRQNFNISQRMWQAPIHGRSRPDAAASDAEKAEPDEDWDVTSSGELAPFNFAEPEAEAAPEDDGGERERPMDGTFAKKPPSFAAKQTFVHAAIPLRITTQRFVHGVTPARAPARTFVRMMTSEREPSPTHARAVTHLGTPAQRYVRGVTSASAPARLYVREATPARKWSPTHAHAMSLQGAPNHSFMQAMSPLRIEEITEEGETEPTSGATDGSVSSPLYVHTSTPLRNTTRKLNFTLVRDEDENDGEVLKRIEEDTAGETEPTSGTTDETTSGATDEPTSGTTDEPTSGATDDGDIASLPDDDEGPVAGIVHVQPGDDVLIVKSSRMDKPTGESGRSTRVISPRGNEVLFLSPVQEADESLKPRLLDDPRKDERNHKVLGALELRLPRTDASYSIRTNENPSLCGALRGDPRSCVTEEKARSPISLPNYYYSELRPGTSASPGDPDHNGNPRNPGRHGPSSTIERTAAFEEKFPPQFSRASVQSAGAVPNRGRASSVSGGIPQKRSSLTTSERFPPTDGVHSARDSKAIRYTTRLKIVPHTDREHSAWRNSDTSKQKASRADQNEGSEVKNMLPYHRQL